MNDHAALDVRKALRLHYLRNGLSSDGGRDADRWTIKLGSMDVQFANVGWRRHALPRHDIHHVLTGYPCTLAGELEIAAWEFAARGWPSFLAIIFCLLPLTMVGFITMPARSFAAFVRGRRSTTLYATALNDALLSANVQRLRDRLLPRTRPVATFGDRVVYLAVTGLSVTLITAVVAIAFVAFFGHV